MACTTPDGESRPLLILARTAVSCLLAVALAACGQEAAAVRVSATKAATTAAPTRTVDLAMIDASGTEPRPRAVEQRLEPVPACPFPQHAEYAAGTILPGHRSAAQLDADVVSTYEEWKADHLVPVDVSASWPPLYRVAFSATERGRTVSEGVGYGMLITVAMAGHDARARHYFDGLWRFSRLHPSSIDRRLMAWQVPESASGDAAAFDGDADMALALLMADRQWGSDGAIDYRREAETLIAALRESMIGPDSHLPMLGDWVDPYGEPHNEFTPRSSDLMPASFRAFAAAAPEAGWGEVFDASLQVVDQVQTRFARKSGLLPDFIESERVGDERRFRPARSGFLEGPHDGDYHYNAGRVPLRLGMDGLLNGGRSLQLLRRIADFAATRVEAVGAGQIGAGFTLDGASYGNYFTSFFAAPLAVALMSDARYQTQLDALYDAIVDRREGYYEDSINLLSLLLLTGNFWTPDSDCRA